MIASQGNSVLNTKQFCWQNRRLRHVQGISLRNLAFTQPPAGSRRKIVDDEDIPSTFKSPTKTLLLRDPRSLEHSRSSADIRSATLADRTLPGNKNLKNFIRRSDNRDFQPNTRTLGGSNTAGGTDLSLPFPPNPSENAVAEKLGDLFFSLHCHGLEDPIYVSEVITRTMNPSFRFFDTTIYSASIIRSSSVKIKFWARHIGSDNYSLLLDVDQHLEPLQYVGQQLEDLHHPLGPNCVLIHANDGIYTNSINLTLTNHEGKSKASQTLSRSTDQRTASFDTLMRLSNLDECVQDALHTTRKLRSQINDLIADKCGPKGSHGAMTTTSSSLTRVESYLGNARKTFAASKARLLDVKSSLEARHANIAAGRESTERQFHELTAARRAVAPRRDELSRHATRISIETARATERLFQIFHIKPQGSSAPEPLRFTIRGLLLPPSHHLEDVDDDDLAAALGYASSLSQLLSQYLRIVLPYPLLPQGSSSTVLDLTSISLGQPHSDKNPKRRFPLYRKAVVGYRFDYGVFLLGKNIEWLVGNKGGRLVDFREILGNLSILGVMLAGAADTEVTLNESKRRDTGS